MFGCESLALSSICLIKDRALRFCHVTHEEEASRDHINLIVNPRLKGHHASIEVDRAHFISAIITLQIND